jgi:hypothetical protein
MGNKYIKVEKLASVKEGSKIDIKIIWPNMPSKTNRSIGDERGGRLF